ncbi:DNA glycosylase AlkZ-like family protein [Longispora urticae]
MVTLDVPRAQVLAYRVAAHQFDRSIPAPRDLDVLDLGVQDTPYGSARIALSARTGGAPRTDGAPDALTLLWAARGAPTLHRTADLPRLAAALWPLSDADATTRIASTAIRDGAKLGVAAFRAAAEAMHDVVRASLPKGEVSTAVSARIPASLTFWCATCGAQHISGALFQQVGLFAGVRLDLTDGTALAPVPGWPGVPSEARGTADVLATYLRLLGPATPTEAAKFLGTTAARIKGAWPGDLTEVRVDGRSAWLPGDAVAALRDAPKPRVVRLLPPLDPYLQARDRDLLVPDKARQSAVWKAIGGPGVVLVDGEVAGTWRGRLAGRKRLDVEVVPFAPWPARVTKEVGAEAVRVAEVRGVPDLRVTGH